MGAELDWDALHTQLEALNLKYDKYEEYNGTWYSVTREHFDLFMLEEPYNSLSMLVNFTSSEYIFRVLGTTRERGFYTDLEDLITIFLAKFNDTVACVGNPRLRVDSGAVLVEQPFSMTVSQNCLGYYTIGEDGEVAQGRGRCKECESGKVQESPKKPATNPTSTWQEETSNRSSDSNTDEDMKIIPTPMEEQVPAVPVKRKRGRPRKIIPLDKLKNKRKLSDMTKQKIAENNKKFSICKLCSKQCRGFRGLVDHMHRDHSDYKPWQCGFCDTKTAFVKTLYRHLKQEHGVNECPCPKCGKTYSRAQSMLFHMSKHEEEDDEEYFECGECQAKFKKKEKLDQHIFKKHEGGYECDHCDKRFSEQSTLKEHTRIHTKERPYQCTECGSTFSFQSTFLSHRKMHLREKGMSEEEARVKLYYFCDVCGKSYANKAGLKIHKLHVHEKYSEEVPCDVCGISFRTRELLKQHQEREHSESPKFACEICGQRFGNSYHLKRHASSHTDEGYPCTQCSRIFKRKDGLDTHFAHAHKDKPNGMHTDDIAAPQETDSLIEDKVFDDFPDDVRTIDTSQITLDEMRPSQEQETEAYNDQNKCYTELVTVVPGQQQQAAIASPKETVTNIKNDSNYNPPDPITMETETKDVFQVPLNIPPPDQYYPPISFAQFDAKTTTIPLGPSGFGIEASLQVIEAHQYQTLEAHDIQTLQSQTSIFQQPPLPIPAPTTFQTTHISNQLSLMSQINQLSQYKATSVTKSLGKVTPISKPGISELQPHNSADMYNPNNAYNNPRLQSTPTPPTSMCIPILEPHMSTPMIRTIKPPQSQEFKPPMQANFGPKTDFEPPQDEAPKRQSVIRMNRK